MLSGNLLRNDEIISNFHKGEVDFIEIILRGIILICELENIRVFFNKFLLFKKRSSYIRL